jgi:hypothetical protein
VRLWKFELQKLADETGLTLHVHHYPPGTSKWNKIEHRLFCQNVEQLAAGQEQMARDIAKLQTAGQDIRRRIAALPPAAANMARKPVPRAQPALQSSAAPLPPAPPEPPSRPPMPVR